MRAEFRISRALFGQILSDLARPHPVADERVGFVFCRFGMAIAARTLILAHEYMAVLDDEYIDSRAFGALIRGSAFRRALEFTLTEPFGIFHIHLHPHYGPPKPSRIDLNESRKFVPDFFHVQSQLPHGALITSLDSIAGRAWLTPTSRPMTFDKTTVVGSPLAIWSNRR
jgi:proteasome lid subunit RPN8/RPN11